MMELASANSPPLLVARRLAFHQDHRAVLSADIVGYTRMMELAGVDGYRRVRELRVGLIDPLVVTFRGEVVKNTGDGFICLFDSAVDALRATVALRAEVAASGAKVPRDARITYRFGLHWGMLIHDAGDVFGHDLNVAVRLQETAPPGGIMISDEFHAAAARPATLEIADLGRLHLKNLSEPVRALLVRAPGEPAFDGALVETLGHDPRRTPAVAVMPFANSGLENGFDHVAGGFVDDIVTSLSNLREIFTISRSSTLGLHRAGAGAGEIAERLGVQYLVSGRLRRSETRWRLSVELQATATGAVIWAERYDISDAEIFDLQDEITFNIVRHVCAGVRDAEIQKALRKPPQSLTAYELFLRGLDLMYRLNAADFHSARRLLEQATEEDPSYAAPFALAAHWHMINAAEGWSRDVDADVAEVLRLSGLATERDDRNALALAINGQAKAMFLHEFDAAIEEVDRARNLSPNNSWAWTFSSGPYGFCGRTEAAIRFAERGLRLSPIDQHAFFKLCLLGQNHYLNGDYASAITWSRRSLDANPRFGNAARVLAASLVATGSAEGARRVSAHHRKIAPNFRLSEYQARCPFQPEAATDYVARLKEAGITE